MHKCDICGKEFETHKKLLGHKPVHYRLGEIKKEIIEARQDLQFKCTYCKKSFKSSEALHGHMASHKYKDVACDHCGKTFKENRLAEHLRSIVRYEKQFDGLIENDDYVICKICNKKAFHLKKHIKAEHNITVEDYKKIFPNALIVSEKVEQKARDSYNKKFGMASRGAAFPQNGINNCESKLLGIMPNNVIYSDRIYYVSARVNNKLISHSPDFIVLDKEYIEEAKKEIAEHNKLISPYLKKSIVKVIEHFGTYWHSEQKTGKSREQHEQDKIDFYALMNKQCLVIWEDELTDLPSVQQRIQKFIES